MLAEDGEVMKYRIHYASFCKGAEPSRQDHVKVIDAATDEEAICAYEAFKKEMENSQQWVSYLVQGGLVRIDQEERTTRII